MKIEIYGKPNCPYCMMATTLLDRKGWEYTYIDLFGIDPVIAQSVLNESGMRTVPMVKVNNIFIGGFDQLDAYIRGVEERKV